MFGWFKSAEAVALGVKLGDAIAARIGKDLQKDSKKLDAKTRDALGAFTLEIDRFKREHKPGLYQKAKMANALRWKLSDAGFDKDYVEDVVRWLILRLN